MPVESLINIGRDADVVAQWIRLAAEHVHESLADTAHERPIGERRAESKTWEMKLLVLVSCRICHAATV